MKEHATLRIAKGMYDGSENRHLSTERFPCLFLINELRLSVYDRDTEPVRLRLKPRKDNGEVAKRNVISEIKKHNDDFAYPIEEPIEEEKEVPKDIRNGKTPAYPTAGNMFKALNRESDRER